MPDLQKDTLYIDVDDEITAIIEKVQNAGHKIVALVLPKRAVVLQSAVNMKLLKRAAEKAKKHVVLITSEAGLLPLAGAVGMHVAPSLQSRPSIPQANVDTADEPIIDEETGEELADFNRDDMAAQPIGRLAESGGFAGAAAGFDEPETIELDNEDKPEPAASAIAAGAGLPAAKKDKKLKVPNFNRFRLILVLGIVLLLVLIVGFIAGSTALAKATISLKTNSSDIATKADLTLDPTADVYDPASNTLPAKIVSKQQTGNQQVSTSGQKNNGTKASGSVVMSSQVCGAAALTSSAPATVPAGTGVSSGGKTFITQEATAFPDSGSFKNGCVTYQATDATKVVAQSAGADYNIAPATFSVAQRSDVSAKSSDAFTGGTDNIVKVVTQADIDSAKAKISGNDSSGVKSDLTGKLQDAGYYPITGSLHAGDPTVTPSAQVGDQADTVTVTQTVTYTMYGAKKSDLKQVIIDNVKTQIDPTKQQILKDGLDSAKYQVSNPVSSGPLQITLTAKSLAGPDIKTDKLAAQLGGKKTGAVVSTVKNIPGVTDVSVKYSPFWVSTVPKNPAKVTILIDK